jgi:hypothetical protein
MNDYEEKDQSDPLEPSITEWMDEGGNHDPFGIAPYEVAIHMSDDPPLTEEEIADVLISLKEIEEGKGIVFDSSLTDEEFMERFDEMMSDKCPNCSSSKTTYAHHFEETRLGRKRIDYTICLKCEYKFNIKETFT